MADFWYKMVKAGKKTLDEVPAKYRDIVREMLEHDE